MPSTRRMRDATTMISDRSRILTTTHLSQGLDHSSTREVQHRPLHQYSQADRPRNLSLYHRKNPYTRLCHNRHPQAFHKRCLYQDMHPLYHLHHLKLLVTDLKFLAKRRSAQPETLAHQQFPKKNVSHLNQAHTLRTAIQYDLCSYRKISDRSSSISLLITHVGDLRCVACCVERLSTMRCL
jgi:hypothetical protein